MHLPPITGPLALLLLLPLPSTALGAKPHNAILLSNVRSLTLNAHAKTTSRRVSPIPQLKCASPRKLCSLPEAAQITTMRCTNTGSSYTSEDIEWSCTASLPSTLRLDRTEVICEGYDSPDDPYVLKGSCGVEYTLSLTDEGRERYPHLTTKGGGGWRAKEGEGEETDWSGVLFGILFVGVLAWILIGACTQWGQNRNNNNAAGGQRRQPRPGSGWGGGGNNGDDDDPPPPYPGTGGGSNTRRPKTTSSSTSSRQQEQGWRPGFWTGLASGAAGGYMAGQRRANTGANAFGGYNNINYDDTYGSRWGGSNRFGGGSGWGGAGPSRPSGSESSGGPSHESTGYGSTSRR
ncbi:transmembrane protein [Triangularia setosa]|uniref:Store-operated calcium entry-associated regulatory factor n=1 Tax=Triangularia setosa TaxID=2587417 RepID=A0AAN6W4G0_9PEZI|nr:transmembrane protein [Podospora setosa]